MTKAGEKILAGARQALAFARGEVAEGFVVHEPPLVDVRAIRRKTGLSQARFAARFGFTADAVRNWEQGRRRPEGPARVLLKVIEREPEAVLRALAEEPPQATPA
jgi:putative transcriptional regulator